MVLLSVESALSKISAKSKLAGCITKGGYKIWNRAISSLFPRHLNRYDQKRAYN